MPRFLPSILTLALVVSTLGVAARAADKPPAKPEAAAPAEKPAGPPPSASPMAELKKSNAQLDKVLHKNVPNWTPEAEL